MAIAAEGAVVSGPIRFGRVQNRFDGLLRDSLRGALQRTRRNTAQPAEISNQIAAFIRRRVQRRHRRFLFTGDIHVIGVSQQMHSPVQRLQLQIVLPLSPREAPQHRTIAQPDIDDGPGIFRTKRPARTRCRRMRTDAGRGVHEGLLDIAQREFAADIRKIGTVCSAAPVNHVAGSALSPAEEEALPFGDVTLRFQFKSRYIEAAHKSGHRT